MQNAYPEKPVIAYKKTTVEMGAMVGYLKGLSAPAEVKHTAYIMFRNEGGNGSKGVNNNYVGAQADGGRWASKWDSRIEGIVKKGENKTGNPRLFLAFSSWTDSVDIVVDRVQGRGLYIGGTPHRYVTTLIKDEKDLAIAYLREWVHGSADYQPTAEELDSFKSMYNQAITLFT